MTGGKSGTITREGLWAISALLFYCLINTKSRSAKLKKRKKCLCLHRLSWLVKSFAEYWFINFASCQQQNISSSLNIDEFTGMFWGSDLCIGWSTSLSGSWPWNSEADIYYATIINIMQLGFLLLLARSTTTGFLSVWIELESSWTTWETGISPPWKVVSSTATGLCTWVTSLTLAWDPEQVGFSCMSKYFVILGKQVAVLEPCWTSSFIFHCL